MGLHQHSPGGARPLNLKEPGSVCGACHAMSG
jgi:hypothetical protein